MLFLNIVYFINIMLTIKMLKELIVNLQTQNNISVCICDHQARDLLACVDIAMILNNGKKLTDSEFEEKKQQVIDLVLRSVGLNP